MNLDMDSVNTFLCLKLYPSEVRSSSAQALDDNPNFITYRVILSFQFLRLSVAHHVLTVLILCSFFLPSHSSPGRKLPLISPTHLPIIWHNHGGSRNVI